MRNLHMRLLSTIALGMAALNAPEALAGKNTRLMPTHFVGVRPAGMGEAFTAVADDQNALYYNPAGLARLDDWSLEILNPLLGWNDADMKSFNAIMDNKDMDMSKAFTDATSFGKVRDLVKEINGRNHYARFGLNPYFVKRNFGLAALLSDELSLVVHNPSDAFGSLSNETDVDVRAGYANTFFGEKLAVGGALAVRNRLTAYVPIEIAKIQDLTSQKGDDLFKDYLRGGMGVGLDAGILFTPIEMWKPTFGLAIQNVGDLRFRETAAMQKLSKQAPDNIPQSVNMGFSITPQFAHDFWTRAAFDVRDMNLPTMAEQKPRLGLEAGWRKRASVQVGYAEGGLSAGFEFRLFVLNLRYSTYVTEQGYYMTQAPERRHLLQVKILL